MAVWQTFLAKYTDAAQPACGIGGVDIGIGLSHFLSGGEAFAVPWVLGNIVNGSFETRGTLDS